jgi:protein arginine N-methyltransferase 5
MDATRETKVQSSVFAMDTNSVAVNELRRRKLTEPDWKQVDILDMDMRDDEFVDLYLGKVDILVSELLGGFGDNELAPECLTACKKLLSPTGVSIPSSTTSYLAPVHARDLRRVMLNSENPTNRERWWVHNQHLSRNTDVVLLARPLPVFSFVYPHNECALYRSRCLQFRCEFAGDHFGKSESWCHGFMGYFEAALHGEVVLSTLPERATPDLQEWNPVFFPAKRTFCLPAQVNMRRASCSKGERVWYSWSVISEETPNGDEHNLNGRHCYMSCKSNKGGPATCE